MFAQQMEWSPASCSHLLFQKHTSKLLEKAGATCFSFLKTSLGKQQRHLLRNSETSGEIKRCLTTQIINHFIPCIVPYLCFINYSVDSLLFRMCSKESSGRRAMGSTFKNKVVLHQTFTTEIPPPSSSFNPNM